LEGNTHVGTVGCTDIDLAHGIVTHYEETLLAGLRQACEIFLLTALVIIVRDALVSVGVDGQCGRFNGTACVFPISVVAELSPSPIKVSEIKGIVAGEDGACKCVDEDPLLVVDDHLLLCPILFEDKGIAENFHRSLNNRPQLVFYTKRCQCLSLAEFFQQGCINNGQRVNLYAVVFG